MHDHDQARYIRTDLSGEWSHSPSDFRAPPTRDPDVLLPLPVEHLVSRETVEVLQAWWLADRTSLVPRILVAELPGASVITPKKRTSPIVAVDPFRQRVRTRSGTIYELGTPEAAFAAHARHLLRTLGL